MELASLDLLFEETAADPLTSDEANALIDVIRIHLDDGSGDFDGADTQVAVVETLSLTAGLQTISFTDGDANVQVSHGTPQTFFVVVDLADAAGSQTPDDFLVTHQTESSSTAEDRDNDIGLLLEYVPNAASTQVAINGKPSDLTLSANTVVENTAAPVVVGSFSTVDPDHLEGDT